MAGSSADPKKAVMIVVALLAIIAAAGFMFKSSRGEANDAAARAEKNATPEAVAKQYESSNIPPQARAAAMNAMRAHGLEASTHK